MATIPDHVNSQLEAIELTVTMGRQGRWWNRQKGLLELREVSVASWRDLDSRNDANRHINRLGAGTYIPIYVNRD